MERFDRPELHTMRDLADYVLKIGGEELPVSAPMAGDLSQPALAIGNNRKPRVTLGVPGSDTERARRFIGGEARLLTNIASPGIEVGRLRILKVDGPKALLVGEILSTS